MLIPLQDKVIVEPVTKEEKTEGGIYIPTESKEDPTTGRVIACGPGKLSTSGELMKTRLEEGVMVVFPSHVGIKHDKYLIMREVDVMAIITEETE